MPIDPTQINPMGVEPPHGLQATAAAPWPTPIAIARAIVAAHPALASLDAAIAAQVDVAVDQASGLSAFATAISRQGAAGADRGWARITEVGQVDGTPVLTYALSEDTLAAAAPVVAEVIATTQADPALRDALWYPPQGAVGGYRVGPAAPGERWSIIDLSDRYALRTPAVSLRDDGGWRVAFANLAPRVLSLYVEFIDAQGAALPVTGWTSRLPRGVDPALETSTCKYLGLITPTRRIEGQPMPSADLDFAFDAPAAATRVRLRFGALAAEPWQADVAALGAITSAVLGYAVPALLRQSGSSAGVWFVALFQPGPLLDEVLAAAQPLLACRNRAEAYAWLGAHLGELLYGGSLPLLRAELLERIGASDFAAAAATLTWAPALLARSTAPSATFDGSVLASPGGFSLDLTAQMVGPLVVEVHADPAHGAWPVAGRGVRVDGVWLDGAAQAEAAVAGLTTADPQPITLAGVPANRSVQLACEVTDAAGLRLAAGTAVAPVNAAPGRRAALVLGEPIPQPQATTRWQHAWNLAYSAAAGHHWAAGPQSGATRRDLDGSAGGHHLAGLVGLALSADHRSLGYVWQASGQNRPICGSDGPTDAQVYGMQTLGALANPERGLVFVDCAYTAQPNLAFGPTPADGYFIDPREGIGRLRAFQIGAPFDQRPQAPSSGRFDVSHLDDLLIHPAGYALAISYRQNAWLSLPLTAAPQAVAGRSGGQGREPGRLSGPVALALAPDGSVLVLEDGNRRIQALDVYGNPVAYFPGGSALLALPAETRPPTYLDLCIDASGRLYVLLYLGQGDAPGDYRLDVYTPDGQPLTRTPGINAARIAIDRWLNLYTLNFKSLAGPEGRTEPELSVFVPTPP
jgi:hypothetical protein